MPFRTRPHRAAAASARRPRRSRVDPGRRLGLLLPAAALVLACAGAQAAAVEVRTRTLAEAAVHPQREASATAVSLNESRLSAQVSARILELPALVGQTVAKGTVVARLDAREYALAVRRAEADLAAARARLKLADAQLARSRELMAQRFIAAEALNQRETDVDVARAQVALAQTALERARLDLARCVVHAPFRAIVLARPGQVGELATPGTALVTVLDADHIEVSAQVQVQDRASLASAGKADFLTESGRYPATLARISPAVRREARTVEARLAFAGERAAPGASGRIVWRDPRPHLPPEVLVRRDGRLGVFVAEGGKAAFVPLPDAQEGRAAAVPLQAGARIVVEGQHRLEPGAGLAEGKP